jgi:2-polyprenyl-6-methoxyphenol hydroxylase-like FAD-dependent oxidoreductase
MSTEATELVSGDGIVCGLRAVGPQGKIEIRARLTVAADGRSSAIRNSAGLQLEDHGAAIDVLWFQLSRLPSDTEQVQARFEPGRVFIMLNRTSYWQCAYVIAKGANEGVRKEGLQKFRASVGASVPFEAFRADEIQSWDQVKLLTVQVNRLRQWWKPGFMCIGDAAHAMSPVGGVGINLAIQDAIAASNILGRALRNNEAITNEILAAVQKRREWPTRVTQRIQLTIHDNILAPALSTKGRFRPPLALRVLTRIPGLRRLPSRILGLGVRPEHVHAA